MDPIATVVNNNQPGWTNIIETAPNVTLNIGTKLYLSPVSLPDLGSPFGCGFFAGAHILNGERYALVIPSKAEGEKLDCQYKTKNFGSSDGTTSDDDGFANSELINDAIHPAAQFCLGLTIGGNNDWALPSRDELALIERNLGPNRKNTPDLFKAGGAEAFETTWYWSSTEYASVSYFAWVVGFGDGYQGYFHEGSSCGVRAVRRLNI